MENYHKKFLVLSILLCCAITHLKADLLNGPYSPESQEIVKLIKDKNLPIPQKFKINAAEINQLRHNFLTINAIDPSLMFFLGEYLSKSTQHIREAALQVMKLLKDKPGYSFYTNLTTDENFAIGLALFACEINDPALFKSSLAKAAQKVKDLTLAELLGQIQTRRHMIKSLKQSNEEILKLKTDAERVFNYIQLILTMGADPNGKITMMTEQNQDFLKKANAPASSLINYYTDIEIDNSEKRDPVLELLISRGLTINTPIEKGYSGYTPEYENLLDKFINLKKYNRDPSIENELQDKINYLKSKGAKTYAEITAAKKRQNY